MFKHHNVGGYIRVFDRGISCLMCHWTDDTLYRDTTAAGRGSPAEHNIPHTTAIERHADDLVFDDWQPTFVVVLQSL